MNCINDCFPGNKLFEIIIWGQIYFWYNSLKDGDEIEDCLYLYK